MKRMIKASLAIDDFIEWYDKLPSNQQAKVDDLADDLGLPLYEDCTDYELAQLHDSVVSAQDTTASTDVEVTDKYIVKIWHEVEANAEDTYGPEAAEEIFEIVATSPEEALERAKNEWSGPIDRIEIVDVNPEETEYDIPFEASTDVNAAKESPATELHKLIVYLNEQGVSEHEMLLYFFDYLPSTQCIEMLEQLAADCDINLEEEYYGV